MSAPHGWGRRWREMAPVRYTPAPTVHTVTARDEASRELARHAEGRATRAPPVGAVEHAIERVLDHDALAADAPDARRERRVGQRAPREAAGVFQLLEEVLHVDRQARARRDG